MSIVGIATPVPTGTLDDHLAARGCPMTDAQVVDRIIMAVALAPVDAAERVRDCLPVDDIRQVPWPDHEGCPWLPRGRSGTWLVYEAPSPRRGHAAQRQYLSAAQVRTGRIDALEMRDDLLAAWFPGDGPRGWDVATVATWLRHHADIADRSRLNRYRARLEAAGFLVQDPAPRVAPEPVTLTLDHSQRPEVGLPRVRTLHLEPHADGTVLLALTICGMGRNGVSTRQRLTADQAARIARALIGGTP